jgi:hypothetical protein
VRISTLRTLRASPCAARADAFLSLRPRLDHVKFDKDGSTGESLVVYKRVLEEGHEKHLEGRSIKPVCRRFN